MAGQLTNNGDNWKGTERVFASPPNRRQSSLGVIGQERAERRIASSTTMRDTTGTLGGVMLEGGNEMGSEDSGTMNDGDMHRRDSSMGSGKSFGCLSVTAQKLTFADTGGQTSLFDNRGPERESGTSTSVQSRLSAEDIDARRRADRTASIGSQSSIKSNGQEVCDSQYRNTHYRNTSVETVDSLPEHQDFYPHRPTSPRAAIARAQNSGSHSRTPSAGVMASSMDQIAGPSTRAPYSHAEIQGALSERFTQLRTDNEAGLNERFSRAATRDDMAQLDQRVTSSQDDLVLVHTRQAGVDQRLAGYDQRQAGYDQRFAAQATHNQNVNQSVNALAAHNQNISNALASQAAVNNQVNHQMTGVTQQTNTVAQQQQTLHQNVNHFTQNIGTAFAALQQQTQAVINGGFVTSQQLQQIQNAVTQCRTVQAAQQLQINALQAAQDPAPIPAVQQPMQAAPAPAPIQPMQQQQMQAAPAPAPAPVTGPSRRAPVTPDDTQQAIFNVGYTNPGHGGAQGYGARDHAMMMRGSQSGSTPRNNYNVNFMATPPNPDDDVFGPGPSFSRRAVAEFDKKDMQELTTSVTVKVETAVRGLAVAVFNPKSNKPNVVVLVHSASDHLDSRKEAITMLESYTLREKIFIGLVNKFIVREIYCHPILSLHPHSQLTAGFEKVWAEEQRVQDNLIEANNFEMREVLTNDRARLGRSITATPGFQQWRKDEAEKLVDMLITQISPLIRPSELAKARAMFEKPISEALKIGIRMRTEAKVYDIAFYSHGSRWDYKRMVQRNDELRGQACDEQPPIWVVRCTMAPYIGEKSFVGGQRNVRTLQKGEVVLCDRKTNLR